MIFKELWNKVLRFIEEIHKVEPYSRNRNHHRFFVVDLRNNTWFFVFNGEDTTLENLAFKGFKGVRRN